MPNEPEAQQKPEFDAGPIVKLYKESMAAWQKSVEAAMEASKAQPAPTRQPANVSATYSNALALSDPFFSHSIDLQREYVRFMAKRWERYLDLVAALTKCRTATEAAEAQKAFFAKTASDYNNESMLLMQEYQRFMLDLVASASKQTNKL
jgi:hypothetical protein